jgi:hypothetical protein
MAYNAYIKKQTVDAVIRTAGEKIEGKISKLPNNRLLDMLNQGEESFIPVIDATVYCLITGNVLFKSEFLAVNKQNIILIADHLLTTKINKSGLLS